MGVGRGAVPSAAFMAVAFSAGVVYHRLSPYRGYVLEVHRHNTHQLALYQHINISITLIYVWLLIA